LLLVAFLLVNAPNCHISHVLVSVVQSDAVNCNSMPTAGLGVKLGMMPTAQLSFCSDRHSIYHFCHVFSLAKTKGISKLTTMLKGGLSNPGNFKSHYLR